jgi:ABC-type multidrug transport system permease subunit
MAVLVLIGTVVSPIGMLLWGVSVDYLSSPITVGLAALVILVIVAVLARSRSQGSNN